MSFSNNSEIIDNEISAIKKAIDNFRQISDLLEPLYDEFQNENDSFLKEQIKHQAERIEQLLKQLTAMLKELSEITNQLNQNEYLSKVIPIQLIATLNVLKAELKLLDHLLCHGQQTFKKAGKLIATQLKPLLKIIGKRIWRLITHLTTIKEWSISGTIGNNVWGLGKVKLEVKFGK